MWVSQTLDRLKTTSCIASDVYPKPLGYGVVLIEKSLGEITLPIPPNNTTPVPAFLLCFPSPPTHITLAERWVVDAFYRIQSTASFIASGFSVVPCFEVYNGTRKLAIPPSSDDTREIFCIATMHPNFPSFEPIQQSDLDICQRVISTNEMLVYVKDLTRHIGRAGALCEVAGCRKLTTRRCSKCKGAYYCGKNHQETDSVEHKVWCENHRNIPGPRDLVGAKFMQGINPSVKSDEKKPWM